MNILRHSILIAYTVLGVAQAQAQTQDPAPPAGRHGAAVDQEQMQARMAETFAKRQARIHDLLKLSTQQEAAWTTYQAVIKPAANAPMLPDRAAIATMSAPDRMAKMLDLSKQRLARMEVHLSALTAFYSQLTPEQKAVFDDHTKGGAHGGGPLPQGACNAARR